MTPRHPSRAGAIAGVLLAPIGLLACADVTYDASATTPPRATTTTTFVPTGTPAELLASIQTSVDALGEQLVAGEGQRQTLARVQAEWAAVRPTIEADHPDLLWDFDSVMAMVARSVERRRPADADKAAKNLAVLIRSAQG